MKVKVGRVRNNNMNCSKCISQSIEVEVKVRKEKVGISIKKVSEAGRIEKKVRGFVYTNFKKYTVHKVFSLDLELTTLKIKAVMTSGRRGKT